jgi:uncharacterized protein (DUF433 family)
MENSEKNRLAAAVLDRWCSFEEALAGSKRTYPLQNFLTFVESARHYIEATRHDQLLRRDVAGVMNRLTDYLRLERKRVPATVLSEGDRLECLFSGVSIRTSTEKNHLVYRAGPPAAIGFRTTSSIGRLAGMFDRITFDPAVMGGRACIRGMRITVALVVNLVANGMSTDDIIREYPELESEDIRQSLQYASALANEEIGFFKSPAA